MKCPHCGKKINIGALLGSVSTPAKAAAARRNTKLGGWPKGKKRGKRKVANKGSWKQQSILACASAAYPAKPVSLVQMARARGGL